MFKKNSFIKVLSFFILYLLALKIVYANSACNEVLILKPSGRSLGQYQQYLNALRSIGLNVKVITASDINRLNCSKENVVVIPGDAADKLSQGEINKIAHLVKSGLNLVTDQHTSLSDALGIKLSKDHFIISSIKDSNHPEIKIRWRDKAKAEKIVHDSLTVFCCESNFNEPVLIGWQTGAGKVLFSSVSFDGEGAFGYGRFPYFHEAFLSYFNLKPFIKRNRLVAYLDLGYHEGENLTDLACRMKSYGINEVHVSGWYSTERSGSLYRDLIQKCHENGILVYLWLEFPMVTKDFWDLHPEWREKTALLADAALDWRKLMALEDPDCFNAVTAYLKEFLKNYEWDGLDLAEFYFESLEGHEHPGQFTPMSDFVRKEFKNIYKFDPALIFKPQSSHYYKKDRSSINKFLAYRTSLCTNLNRKFLSFLKNDGIDKSHDVYLTQIANPFDEKLNRNIGVEVKDFIGLQKDFRFTMQAEDPYPLWVLGPDRYKKIGTAYRKMLGNKAILTIDINIVDEGREDPFPTDVQTGLEFTELLNIASQNCDRVCIYAVSTPMESDFRYAPFALASFCSAKRISQGEYVTDCAKSFVLEADSAISSVLLDGQEWNCLDEKSVIIPSGKHKISVSYGNRSGSGALFIKDISCEIESFRQNGSNPELSYRDNRNVYIRLNRLPAKVLLNNKEYSPKVYFNTVTKDYTICCPGGNNSVIFADKL